MRSFVVTAAPARQKTDCAIVGVHEGGNRTGAAAALDQAIAGRLTRLIKQGDFHGKQGEVRLVDTDGAPFARIALVGLGKKGKFDRKHYRKALIATLGAIAKTHAR